MAVVEDDAHGVIADGLQARDAHAALAGDGGIFSWPWPFTSALGDCTRRYSAASSMRSLVSKVTLKESFAGLSRSSVGQRLILGRHARSASVNSRASSDSMIGMPSRMG